MRKERWRQVEGFPDYHVSDHGRVKSARKGRLVLLSGHKRPDGYLTVNLRRGEQGKTGRYGWSGDIESKTIAVHILVARAFIGPCPEGQMCRHFDGNPQNNHYRNLRYGTMKDNARDTLRHGRYPRGEQCYNAKLNTRLVIKIRRLLAEGMTATEVRRLFEKLHKIKLTRPGIREIGIRKTWRHVL